MMHSCTQRRRMTWSLCLVFSVYNLILVFASHATHLCRPDQKDALWEFKSEFYVDGFHSDDTPVDKKTERWRNNIDCCSWDGISCDPKTGKVVELDLMDSFLNGPLRSNSSLFRLQDLHILNLGSNNLSGILPDSISNLKYLRVLSLSGCSFCGMIPSSLGNLSYLTNLDLSHNDFIGKFPDSMGNLRKLTDLGLDHNKISGNFPHVLLNMSELTQIDIGSNQFEGMLPSNMSSLSKLVYFDINENSFYGSIPSSLFMIPSLIQLYMGRNSFSGPLEIGNVSSLSTLGFLSIGENNFNGPIPKLISKLVGLWYLDLASWNTEKGKVDFNIFLQLKSLTFLDLSYINTRSMVDLSLFSDLTSLGYLDLSGINLKVSPTLHLLSPIEILTLSSCNIAEFPKFLETQTSLSYLDISANQIKGQVPKWLWSLPLLRYVNISQNAFTGFEGSADVIQRSEIILLDISSNTFQDPFPLLPNSTKFFLGSNNKFSGEIPRIICKLASLDTLVLSDNNFNGSIPRCFENFSTKLSVMHLRNNSLSGNFPEVSIGDHLKSLDVGGNRLSGVLPRSLINCTRLEFLNVENNMINDTFPFWLRFLTNLQVLVLRSNEFHGPISSPGVSLSFPKLRIFDISKNSFTGVLPSYYFAGWTAMSLVIDIVDILPSRFEGRDSGNLYNSVSMTAKGLVMELVGSGFTIYKTIDVSGNKLEGSIPESISLLKELIVLNMSNNAFTGHISPSLENLTNLQSLDLSLNRLSGEIPPELGKLTFLARMNFSYNMLEGPIPQGTQIQSQSSSSFAENPRLCGVPLQETCGIGDGATTQEQEDEDEEKEEKDQVLSWIAAAIGYVPGVFCGFVISHILTSYKRDWFMKIFHSFA
ncbi:receptor-like protein 48 [Raphanus sativus]|uniref:Receptor-like protein 48 n=1 Tax=Raphanus sativus TaxID=3726 RepID=A0A9W3DQH6_RAPSA|nr:receptor-like protein 48 [Raphanus sativus]